MTNYKFNRKLDEKIKAGVQPLFDMDGKPIVMSGLFKRRLKAQLEQRALEERRSRGGKA